MAQSDFRSEARALPPKPAFGGFAAASRRLRAVRDAAGRTLRGTMDHVPGGRALSDVLGAPGARRFTAALALMAATTIVAFGWQAFLGSRNLALLFIIATAVAGAWLGVLPALLAAVAAFFSYNYFLVEPRFALEFAAADILALLSFLGSALAVGWLSGRLSERARLATERLNSLTTLFETSRDLSAATEAREVAARLVKHLTQSRFKGAAIWGWENGRARLLLSETVDQEWARDVGGDVAGFLASDLTSQRLGNVTLHRLSGVHGTIGAAALWGEARGEGDEMWTQAMLDLGAAAIERDRLMSQVAQAELVAEREGLRTALLSSLSHDLRTPIATILASASGLLEHSARFDEATRLDLARAVQDEAERLNRYVSHLLDMTRLESGALVIKPSPVDPREIILAALDHMRRRLAATRIHKTFPPHAHFVRVDPLLLEQALLNVLENAASYGGSSGAIKVGCEVAGDQIVMFVEDDGPGIPVEDLSNVFAKFFRGRSDRRKAAGVGLGLSVTKGLVEALGGRVRAVSPIAQGRGSRFEFHFAAIAAPEQIDE
jgi:two-component system sensor histidine kinase KdpD